ncbi:alpha/beta hydrolase [Olivibacter domesticus]|uniref:Serine aminopeptidase S33 domain-containing protein n=1 Tax=Olivibacter domesticus TaxID=407022 RepID=A0A1H7X0E2_OLID1|nr:alpha/beta hydrolase [Olivibacter domesticus]SEM27332.1 hypothetical protein SAMN05661044_04759 [Olivibacter domesticus]
MTTRIYSLLLIVLLIDASSLFAQINNMETASQFISSLASSKYDDALNNTSVDFKAKVSTEAMAKIWNGLNEQFGRYETLVIPDSIDKNATPLTLSATFQHYIVPLTFHFNAAHELVGFFIQQTPKVRSNVSKSPANFPEEEVKIKVKGGIIGGTIMTPKNPQKGMPIALIIAGSGPTNRNGNNPYGAQSNTYLLLAEALADNGIASFRYDKRLIGESAHFENNQNKVVFNDFVEDAVILGQFLKSRKDFGKLYIIGHSEGSNIGMIAAQQLNPAAFISIAGPGENLAKILETQLLTQPHLADEAKPIINLLVQGKTVKKVPPELNGLFDSSIQPFIISSFKVEPLAEIKKLTMPILLVAGTNDLQVPFNHAEKLKQANPKAVLLLIKNMNHVLKTAPASQQANLKTYANPNLPLNTDLIIGLINFLK